MHHRQIHLDCATSTFTHVFREVLEDLDCPVKAALDFEFVSFAKFTLPSKDRVVALLSLERLLELRRAVTRKPFRHSDQSLSVTSDRFGIGSQRFWGPQPSLELAQDTTAIEAAHLVESFLVRRFDRVEEHVAQDVPLQ